MITTLIFDLSEVFILGVLDIEQVFAEEHRLCSLDEARDALKQLVGSGIFLGHATEDEALQQLLDRYGWQTDLPALKQIIRRNFHHEIAGSLDVLARLRDRGQYQLILLSDHCREWIDYIRAVHPFLSLFDRTFFSFDLKSIKRSRETFVAVLQQIGETPDHCLFIDDSPVNVSVATSLGISSIQFTGAPQLIAALKGYGIYV